MCRRHLGVPVLIDMQVQHPGDECPAQARSGPAQHGEHGAGQLGCSWEVQDTEVFAKLPVWSRREVERLRCTPRADNHVVVIVGAYGHRLVWQIGQLQHDLCDARLLLRS